MSVANGWFMLKPGDRMPAFAPVVAQSAPFTDLDAANARIAELEAAIVADALDDADDVEDDDVEQEMEPATPAVKGAVRVESDRTPLRKAAAWAAICSAGDDVWRASGFSMSREAARLRACELDPQLVSAYRNAEPDLPAVAKAEPLPGAEHLEAIRRGAAEMAESRRLSQYEAMRQFLETDEGQRLRAELARAEGR